MSDFFSGKRVVVTGGAGFLGRHVVRKLDERGWASVVVARRATCDLRQWSQICELLEQARPHLVWDRTKPGGQPRRCWDTSRAERAFRFRASRDFWKGLQETLDWYRERVLEQRSDEQDHVGTSQY